MRSWGVVVPVKRLSRAKSRLTGYDDQARADLALAFAEDVVAAANACPAVACVLVVTDDARATQALSGSALVVPDLPNAGLNPALVYGAEQLRERHPDLGIVALSSDLPALRSADLTDVLSGIPERAFVSDARGSGTTLLAATDGDLRPAYGQQSRRAHLASGASERAAANVRVRLDVDTPHDLRDALRLGVGRRTRAAVDRVGAPPA